MTWRTLAAIDVKAVLEISQFAVGLLEVAQGGSACCYRVFKNAADDRHQACDAGCCNLACLARGVDACPVKRFTDIDISKPRNDTLVQQR